MISTQLIAGKVYSLPTIPSDNENYLMVKTDDGKEFRIKKLKFQLTEGKASISVMSGKERY